ELADGLAADGVQCVMVGTAADAGTAHDVERSAKASRPMISLIGRTDLPTLAGVFDNCRALVTNDSGAMHLAAAVGIPVTAMFGPTNEQATSPHLANLRPRPTPPSLQAGTEVASDLRPRQLTILTHAIWCRPCMLRECPLDHRCMRGIEVAT